MFKYPIFSVLGIEIEYMIVDKHSLDVKPLSDVILRHFAKDENINEVELGDIAISNELVMHVLELKNNGPKPPNAPIATQFQEAIETIQTFLDSQDLLLLPTGAHPWMNPTLETKRWPYGNRDIYHQFDSIFDCKGHGFSNLQSMHLNFPFANDEEFNQLHNAIRLFLPLLPAIAASTPFIDGKFTGMMDSRLDFYEKNQQRIPSITGLIIPDFISSEKEYQEKILAPMYRDIAPFDHEHILQYEWLNSRGAIAKFNSHAIEIRVLDSQECVNADIAIAKAVFAIVKHLQEKSSLYLDNPCDTAPLKHLYDRARIQGFNAPIEDHTLYTQWGLKKPVDNCRHAWSALIENVSSSLDDKSQATLDYLLTQGNLSERLLSTCGSEINKSSLARVYRQLSHCLLTNEQLSAS